jgi:hypothetical protein
VGASRRAQDAAMRRSLLSFSLILATNLIGFTSG